MMLQGYIKLLKFEPLWKFADYKWAITRPLMTHITAYPMSYIEVTSSISTSCIFMNVRR